MSGTITRAKAMLALYAIFIPNIAHADSLKDWLDKPPQGTFTSNKSALQVEHCIGLGMSDWLTVASFRGENNVELYASPTSSFSNAIYISVTIEKDATSSKVSFRAHKAWDDKTADLIESCI